VPLTAIGKITLGGVQLSTDPETYEPLLWEKRYSVQSGLNGALTIQDFGTFKKDNRIRLVSGASQFLDQATVAALHAKFRERGASFTLTDWIGNEFTVFIAAFRPVPTFLDDLWTYDLELVVINIVKLFGAVYTEA
jgi:hypothetical protein